MVVYVYGGCMCVSMCGHNNGVCGHSSVCVVIMVVVYRPKCNPYCATFWSKGAFTVDFYDLKRNVFCFSSRFHLIIQAIRLLLIK